LPPGCRRRMVVTRVRPSSLAKPRDHRAWPFVASPSEGSPHPSAPLARQGDPSPTREPLIGLVAQASWRVILTCHRENLTGQGRQKSSRCRISLMGDRLTFAVILCIYRIRSLFVDTWAQFLRPSRARGKLSVQNLKKANHPKGWDAKPLAYVSAPPGYGRRVARRP